MLEWKIATNSKFSLLMIKVWRDRVRVEAGVLSTIRIVWKVLIERIFEICYLTSPREGSASHRILIRF